MRRRSPYQEKKEQTTGNTTQEYHEDAQRRTHEKFSCVEVSDKTKKDGAKERKRKETAKKASHQGTLYDLLLVRET
jgi:hypothetical protein